jgi:hypothetical protein
MKTFARDDYMLDKLMLQNLIEEKHLIPLAFCPLHSFCLLLMVLRLLASRYFFRNRMVFGVTFIARKKITIKTIK